MPYRPLLIGRTPLIGALVAGVLALGACTTPDPSVTLPEITYQHAPSLNLAVDRIEIVEAYKPTLVSPNVEHKMRTPPAKALAIWGRDRLKAVGGGNGAVARLTIEQARVTETALPRTQGIKGAFTTDQSARYNLEMSAVLEIIDARGRRVGHAAARATRTQTTPEDVNLNDLHRTWFDMMEAALKDFDREMEANMRRFLVNWMR
ncbi:MAG: hypothetical protein COW30_13725 [Rhodospirillales bacterium CG15_BIG_FIL_POST_REV_8_21_14_020_66_15]|nr:MAG: hypothetical protein COW30_13725 [Rhodospirillales bacterium CG15_BIG_FIL_POST_REV_8_21_14_020_66_15]